MIKKIIITITAVLYLSTNNFYGMKKTSESDCDIGSKKQTLDAVFSSLPVTFKDLAGEIPSDIAYMAASVTMQKQLNKNHIEIPHALLIAGKSGVGKTLLAHALAGQTGAHITHHCGLDLLPELPIIQDPRKQTIEKINTIFNAAQSQAHSMGASVAMVLIDSWDIFINSHVIINKYKLFKYIQECLHKSCNSGTIQLFLIAETTNEYLPTQEEEQLYSFFTKISIDLPNASNREAILKFYSTPHSTSITDLDISSFMPYTNGKTGRELKKLVHKAITFAYQQALENGISDKDITLTKKHILKALGKTDLDIIIKPGIKTTTAPVEQSPHLIAQCITRFSDIAGTIPHDIQELADAIKESESFTHYGLLPPHGILLSGPTGTGKTLLARAIAGEIGAGFFTACGSEFIEHYIGVGAQRVRDLFDEAKKYIHQQPDRKAIIFIDEIDAVGCARLEESDSGSRERAQTVNELLNQIDGFKSNKNITIIAATNRPHTLDQALIRPGRFDKKIEIGLPDSQKRKAVLQFYANKIPAQTAPSTLDFDSLAQKTDGLNNAELEEIVNEAKSLARRAKAPTVSQKFFNTALETVIKQKNMQSNEPPLSMFM